MDHATPSMVLCTLAPTSSQHLISRLPFRPAANSSIQAIRKKGMLGKLKKQPLSPWFLAQYWGEKISHYSWGTHQVFSTIKLYFPIFLLNQIRKMRPFPSHFLSLHFLPSEITPTKHSVRDLNFNLNRQWVVGARVINFIYGIFN